MNNLNCYSNISYCKICVRVVRQLNTYCQRVGCDKLVIVAVTHYSDVADYVASMLHAAGMLQLYDMIDVATGCNCCKLVVQLPALLWMLLLLLFLVLVLVLLFVQSLVVVHFLFFLIVLVLLHLLLV